MIAKKMSIVLLVLATVCASLEAREQKTVKRNFSEQTRACCKKSTCAPTVISSARTITESGPYCLSRNIVGTIVIDADDVTLDLNSHQIDADGNPNAISMQNVHNVKVFNGSIVNASDAGIFVDPSFGIELSDLYMAGNQLDAIRVEESTDVAIHHVTFVGTEGGERGVHFNSCSAVNVSNCSATGFLSTLGAIVELNDCQNGLVSDVIVSGNTKRSSADVFFFDPGSALVNVASSNGIILERVLVNNNTFDNTVQINPDENFRVAAAIQLTSCQACSLTGCETSNNIDIAGSSVNDDTEDYLLNFFLCDSCTVTAHKSNDNRCEPEPIAYFQACGVLDSTNIVFDRCEFNNNIVQELLLWDFQASFIVVYIAPYFTDISSNFVLSNCQINGNQVINSGGPRFTLPTAALMFGMDLFGSNYLFENCQFNGNQMGGAQPFTITEGLHSHAENVKILNSTFNSNIGGSDAAGLGTASGAFHMKLEGSTFNGNGRHGLVLGIPSAIPTQIVAHEVVVENCEFINNGSGAVIDDTSGIKIYPGAESSKNIVIKGCQILDTISTSTDNGNAAGIYVIAGTNIVIEDTNVFNTTSSLFAGHGIVFEDCTDSKILRSQVHGNQDAGVRLNGLLDNITIVDNIAKGNDKGFTVPGVLTDGVLQGNRAQGNTTVGFEHSSFFPVPFSTVYQNNYAQNNGINYNINNIIQRHEYNVATATYIFAEGNTDLPEFTNIDTN